MLHVPSANADPATKALGSWYGRLAFANPAKVARPHDIRNIESSVKMLLAAARRINSLMLSFSA